MAEDGVEREEGGDKWTSKQPGEAREVRYSVYEATRPLPGERVA
jgi:hypothetical protein